MARSPEPSARRTSWKELTIWIVIMVTICVGIIIKTRYDFEHPTITTASDPVTPTSTWRAAAQELVRQQLRDPSSAEFSDVNVKSATPGHVTVVCGYVNATNGFGGMTGRQRFVAGNIVTIESSVGSEAMGQLWNGVC